MRVLKYILAFALPILLFLNLWRFVRLGDNYSFSGLSDTAHYLETFKGFDDTYNNILWIGRQFKNPTQWVFDILSGVFFIYEAVVIPATLIFNLVKDVIETIVWFFGWIIIMV